MTHSDKTPPFSIVLPAAGSGVRLDEEKPKALVKLQGIPIIFRTLRRFLGMSGLQEVIILLPPELVDDDNELIDDLQKPDPVRVIKGGDTRLDSVTRGFRKLNDDPSPEYVLIHDGARPLVSRKLIRRVRKKTFETGAAIAAIPASSTMKRADHGVIRETVNRKEIYLAQTPQGFRYDWFQESLQQLSSEERETITDDAMILEQAGYDVHVVDGHRRNLKITYPEDLQLASDILG